MKEKVKVCQTEIGEPVRQAGASTLVSRLVDNPLVRNPLVALAGHLAGLLLRLLPRRPGKPRSAAPRCGCRSSRASVRRMKLESFSFSRVSPSREVAKRKVPEGCPKDPRTLPEGCPARQRRVARSGPRVSVSPTEGGLAHG